MLMNVSDVVGKNVEIVEISPKQAADWLVCNDSNRPLTKRKVLQYAESIKANKWKLNAETIKFSADGRLLDGQHRLLGCIEAGTSFKSYVAFQVDAEVFDTIDTGRPRSGSDILSMRGTPNAIVAASAAGWVIKFRAGVNTKAGQRTLNPYEIQELIEREPDIIQSVRFILAIRDILRPGIAGALHYLFGEKDADGADRFFTDLMVGENLPKNDAVFVLREQLIRRKMEHSKIGPLDICAMVIRAWGKRRTDSPAQQFIRGRTRKHEGSQKNFPEII